MIHIEYHLFSTHLLSREAMLFHFSKTYDSSDHKKFGVLFTERFWWQNSRLGDGGLHFWHFLTHITSTFGDMLKDNVYGNNPYSEESLTANIWNVMYEIPPSQLWHVRDGVFLRYNTCLRVSENCLEHPLYIWWVQNPILLQCIKLKHVDPDSEEIGRVASATLPAIKWNDWSVEWCIKSDEIMSL